MPGRGVKGKAWRVAGPDYCSVSIIPALSREFDGNDVAAAMILGLGHLVCSVCEDLSDASMSSV